MTPYSSPYCVEEYISLSKQRETVTSALEENKTMGSSNLSYFSITATQQDIQAEFRSYKKTNEVAL